MAHKEAKLNARDSCRRIAKTNTSGRNRIHPGRIMLMRKLLYDGASDEKLKNCAMTLRRAAARILRYRTEYCTLDNIIGTLSPHLHGKPSDGTVFAANNGGQENAPLF